MLYELDSSKLSEYVVEVRQFEHNVTSVYTEIPIEELYVDPKNLTPCILLSVGEEIQKDNGLSYGLTDEKAILSWEISEDCTQRAGTFLAQFAFITNDGTVKFYTDKFVFKVLPSVDIQKAIFENRPRFVERLWNKIVQRISDSLPTKVSELENDKGYITSSALTEYAKTEEVTDGLSKCAKTVDIDSTLKEYAKTSEVNESLGEYAKTAEVTEKLEEYAKTEVLSKYVNTSTLSNYAKTAEVTQKINSYSNGRIPKAIITSSIPTSALTQSIGEASALADSTSTYTEYYFYGGAGVLSLEKASVVITSPSSCTVSGSLIVELNSPGVRTAGATICNVENFFSPDNSTIVFLEIEVHKNVTRVILSKYLASDISTPLETRSFILGKRYTVISGIRLKFVPDEDAEVTTNFASSTKIEIIGTAKK